MLKATQTLRFVRQALVLLTYSMLLASCASEFVAYEPPPSPTAPPVQVVIPPAPAQPRVNLADPDDVSSAHGNLAPYPWPPERPSTQSNLTSLFGAFTGSSLLAVGDVLRYAADAAGYDDKSFYSAPNGFVLATRLEATTAEGKRLEGLARYRLPLTQSDSLTDSLANISGRMPAGNFRYIAFVVSDQPIVFSAAIIAGSIASERALNGATNLDASFSARPFTDRHQVLALIYEFKASGQPVGTIELLRPSALGGSDHLAAAGLYSSIKDWTTSAGARGLRAP